MEADSFFRRWARAPRDGPAADVVPNAGRVRETAPGPADILPGDAAADAGSEVAALLRPDADPDLRRAALKRLFADPHFGKPDGLDVYMDDYNAVAPLGAAMLASLDHAASLFKSRDAAREEGEPPAETIPAISEAAETDDADSDAATTPSPPRDEDAEANAPAGSRGVPPAPEPTP
ncbi:MAG: DUF3306 domain-containing protein [Burkholderiaceae bacterium]